MALQESLSFSAFNASSLVFLTTKDLANIQTVDTTTRASCELSFAWSECTERECSYLEVARYLYQQAHRHEVMRSRALLKGVVLAKEAKVSLSSADVALRLQRSILMCQSVAQRHRENGGRVARVLISKFQVALPIASQKPSAFSLGVEGPGGCKGELRLSLGLDDDATNLSISAMHSRTAILQRFVGAPLEPAGIIIDIYSASTSMDLGCRNMLLKVDNMPCKVDDAWVNTSCATSQDLDDGVPCVLCVREAPSGKA
mmetsp:Transcript_68648/g.149416  ORF Transcript_68648/g.149416 Transcript_68648/m.149416 type:complete len:258 (+) Transcript_68648:89-862(+)